MQEYYWDRTFRGNFWRKEKRLHQLRLGITILFFLTIAGVLGVGILFAWYAKDLPRPDKVRRVEGLSTVILDRTGETIYDIFEDQNRIPVSFDNIPKDCRNATVAVEDKNFYTHQGLSSQGIMRAIVNIFIFRNFQGGSTLTQQLVKNVLLSQERTLPRKMKEAILAIQIERKYSKDEILQMYLNEAPYGGTAVGLEAAAKYYFDKHAKDLTRTECVILSGLPQSPSYYSPYANDEKAYIPRAQQVLRRMREDGYITQKEETEEKLKIDQTKFSKGDIGIKAAHFVSYIKDQLIAKFGEKAVNAGGLKVTTTLDLKFQESAEKIVKEEVNKIKNLKVSNGAAVVIDPKTGEILAMVGSKDYSATDAGGLKFNVVTQGLRQPGSTIKPFSYAAFLKKGYTASTVLMDVDTKYPSGDPKKPEYNPKNYDLKYRGPMQLRYALANSINTIAVKVSAMVGIRDILRLANDMGITTLEPNDENMKRIGLSLTLGGGEVRLLDITNAFGVFGTGGLSQEPKSLLKVEDAKGKVLFEQIPTQPKRVLSQDVAFIISNILADNSARKDVFGERSYLYIPDRTVAVKTGTTDDKRDNWTIGYTPSVVVGVWVGNNDNSPMNPSLASGITGAAPIWNRIIKEYLKDKKDEPFIKPDNVLEMEIDAFGGGTPVDGQSKRKEFFIKGTEPTSKASLYQTLKLSKKDGNKLANAVEIAKGEYNTKDFFVFKESDPVSSDGKNRWQEGIDAWINAQSESKYKPPRDTYEGDDKITITIKEPGDKTQINGNVSISAEATSVGDITKMELYIDNDKKKESNGKSISDSFALSNGMHSIRIKAQDNKGNATEREISISVNQPYGTPTPLPTVVPTETSTPTPTP
jgi:1A family penicillin-binding protein